MQVGGVVRVSSKGQIVIPRSVRKKLGIEPGERLLVTTDKAKMLLRKLGDLSLEEISTRTSRVVESEGIDVSTLVDEAVSWARKEERGSK